MLYDNEEEIGEALKECFAAGIKREDVFITCKLWWTESKDAAGAVARSLKRLQLDYLDLYLIHFMRPDIDTSGEEWKITSPPLHVVWKVLEDQVHAGKIRSIGVSNCTMTILMDVLAYCEITPAVNQIECHPYLQQTQMAKIHHKFGIYIQAYAAIGAGAWPVRADEHKDVNVLKEPVIEALAAKYGKSPAQIVINWHLRNKTIPLVKTVTPARLAENMAAHTFEMSQEDADKINHLDANIRLFNPRWIAGWGHDSIPYFE